MNTCPKCLRSRALSLGGWKCPICDNPASPDKAKSVDAVVEPIPQFGAEITATRRRLLRQLRDDADARPCSHKNYRWLCELFAPLRLQHEAGPVRGGDGTWCYPLFRVDNEAVQERARLLLESLPKQRKPRASGAAVTEQAGDSVKQATCDLGELKLLLEDLFGGSLKKNYAGSWIKAGDDLLRHEDIEALKRWWKAHEEATGSSPVKAEEK